MPATLGEDKYSLTLGKATFNSSFNTNSSDWSEFEEHEIRWSVWIDASYDFEHDGHTYSEPISFYDQCFQFPKTPCNWDDLIGQVIKWDDPSEIAIDGTKPSFYLGEHQDIDQGTIQFVERNGSDFRILWQGVTGGVGVFYVDTCVKFQRD